MMVTYVLFPKKDAIPRLEAMKRMLTIKPSNAGLKNKTGGGIFLTTTP
jgi:hypothetical protein